MGSAFTAALSAVGGEGRLTAVSCGEMCVVASSVDGEKAPRYVASSSLLGYLQLAATTTTARDEAALLLPGQKEGCALQLCGAL
jgi:hypothetical protein